MRGHCLTLWIGKSLGPVERACLKSVVRHGHRLTLYCYRAPDGIPEGVELEDAGTILPETAVFRHWTGSLASFADWFRYEALRAGLGTWVDADLYLLAPLDGDAPYLFGEQEPGVLNNAVLRLPPDSPMLGDLIGPFEGAAPPADTRRRWIRRKPKPAELPWGATGPAALTAAAKAHGLLDRALPPELFYPVPWREAEWIRDPTVQLDDVIGGRTVGVHLWNQCIQHFKNEPAPAGSFLARLHREGQA